MRESPSPQKCTTSSSSTAATSVQEGGLGTSSDTVAAMAFCPAAAASVNSRVMAASRLSGTPSPRGSGGRSTSSTACAAFIDPMWESTVLDTPSQTTRTTRGPSTAIAIASSLRWCRIPRSQTPPTQGAGCSSKWSRGSGALVPHWVQ